MNQYKYNSMKYMCIYMHMYNCIYEVYMYIYAPRSSIGEGNGTPLQYSCLENPMVGGDWKAAVHGVAEGLK